jgi:hypothetical protein
MHCNTCQCKYNIEFGYYYDMYIHIHRVFYTNHVKECLSIVFSISSRNFICSIKCLRLDGKKILCKILFKWDMPEGQWIYIFELMHS